MSKKSEYCDDDLSEINTFDTGSVKKKGALRKILNLLIVFFALFLVAAVSVKMDLIRLIKGYFYDDSVKYNLMYDFSTVCGEARAQSAAEIKTRKPIYALELDRYVAPEPDPSKYDDNFQNYSDSTIDVHYYKERMHDSWFHFMEVRIKHPSQFRMALANDSYGSSRRLPHLIASDVNAVAAVNGSFYNRRWGGVLIYRREMLRNRPYSADTLLIDADGNFHIVDDKHIEESRVLEQYDIVNALTFGPELVRDGQALKIKNGFWEPYTDEPRTAICQFEDDLHYLICLAEGRNKVSVGVTMSVFTRELAAKGVKCAYNLDGGQSGTMIIGNRVKNRGGWGPEKAQGDILYFATALEENERDS